MPVVEIPVPATERWTLARDFDSLRFDVLSARSVADRLRRKEAVQFLADTTSPENLRNTVAHLDSILAFLAEINDQMRLSAAAEEHSIANFYKHQ